MKTTTNVSITHDSESEIITVTVNFGEGLKPEICNRPDVMMAAEAIRHISDLFGSPKESSHG